MIVNNQLVEQNLKEFDKNYDYVLHKDSKKKTYVRNQTNDNIHWGQMKLFLSELNFLNHYYNPEEVKDVVYVGAAGGYHIVTLSEMFPDLHFHLFDTEPFYTELRDNPMVHINNRYFGDYDIEEWKTKPCLFISDIRNLNYDSSKTKMENRIENEKYVWNDMTIQQSWVQLIKPIHSLLKFRLPYAEHYALREGETREYLDGTVYIQPFSKRESSETRLHVDSKNLYTKHWNIIDYEEKLCHHNFEVRAKYKYKNPISNNTMIHEKHGLYNDYDSVYLANVIIDYLEKINRDKSEENVKNMIDYIMKNMGTSKTLKDLRDSRK